MHGTMNIKKKYLFSVFVRVEVPAFYYKTP